MKKKMQKFLALILAAGMLLSIATPAFASGAPMTSEAYAAAGGAQVEPEAPTPAPTVGASTEQPGEATLPPEASLAPSQVPTETPSVSSEPSALPSEVPTPTDSAEPSATPGTDSSASVLSEEASAYAQAADGVEMNASLWGIDYTSDASYSGYAKLTSLNVGDYNLELCLKNSSDVVVTDITSLELQTIDGKTLAGLEDGFDASFVPDDVPAQLQMSDDYATQSHKSTSKFDVRFLRLAGGTYRFCAKTKSGEAYYASFELKLDNACYDNLSDPVEQYWPESGGMNHAISLDENGGFTFYIRPSKDIDSSSFIGAGKVTALDMGGYMPSTLTVNAEGNFSYAGKNYKVTAAVVDDTVASEAYGGSRKAIRMTFSGVPAPTAGILCYSGIVSVKNNTSVLQDFHFQFRPGVAGAIDLAEAEYSYTGDSGVWLSCGEAETYWFYNQNSGVRYTPDSVSVAARNKTTGAMLSDATGIAMPQATRNASGTVTIDMSNVTDYMQDYMLLLKTGDETVCVPVYPQLKNGLYCTLTDSMPAVQCDAATSTVVGSQLQANTLYWRGELEMSLYDNVEVIIRDRASWETISDTGDTPLVVSELDEVISTDAAPRYYLPITIPAQAGQYYITIRDTTAEVYRSFSFDIAEQEQFDLWENGRKTADHFTVLPGKVYALSDMYANSYSVEFQNKMYYYSATPNVNGTFTVSINGENLADADNTSGVVALSGTANGVPEGRVEFYTTKPMQGEITPTFTLYSGRKSYSVSNISMQFKPLSMGGFYTTDSNTNFTSPLDSVQMSVQDTQVLYVRAPNGLQSYKDVRVTFTPDDGSSADASLTVSSTLLSLTIGGSTGKNKALKVTLKSGSKPFSGKLNYICTTEATNEGNGKVTTTDHTLSIPVQVTPSYTDATTSDTQVLDLSKSTQATTMDVIELFSMDDDSYEVKVLSVDSSSKAVATAALPAENGTEIAVTPLKPGTTRLTIRAICGTRNLTFTVPVKVVASITSVSLTASAQGPYCAGQKVTFTASCKPDNTTDSKKYAFTVENQSGEVQPADVAAVTLNSTHTAATVVFLAEGEYTVKAAAENGVSGTAQAVVQSAPKELYISKSTTATTDTIYMTVNTDCSLQPMYVGYAAVTIPYLDWNSENPEIASVRAPQGQENIVSAHRCGKTNVTALALNGKKVTYTICVLPLEKDAELGNLSLTCEDAPNVALQAGMTVTPKLCLKDGTVVDPSLYTLTATTNGKYVEAKENSAWQLNNGEAQVTVVFRAVLKDDPLGRTFTQKFTLYPKQAASAEFALENTPEITQMRSNGILSVNEEQHSIAFLASQADWNQDETLESIFDQTLPLKMTYKDYQGNALAASPVFVSSNTAVASVTRSGLLAINGTGRCTITVYANDSGMRTDTISFTVMDYTPRLAQSSVSFNMALEEGGALTLYAAEDSALYDASYAPQPENIAELSPQNAKFYTTMAAAQTGDAAGEDSRFTAAYVSGSATQASSGYKEMTLRVKSNTTCRNAATYLRVCVLKQDTQGKLCVQNCVIPVRITATKSIPAAKISATGQNLFMINENGALTIQTPANAIFDHAEIVSAVEGQNDFALGGQPTIQGNSSTYAIRADNARYKIAHGTAFSAINRNYTVQVYYVGYDVPYTKVLKLPASYTAPKAVLAANDTLNLSADGTAMPVSVTVNGEPQSFQSNAETLPDGTSYSEPEGFSTTAVLNFDGVNVPEGGSAKCKCTLQVITENWLQPVSVTKTFALKRVALKTTLSAKSLALNMLDYAPQATAKVSIQDTVDVQFDAGTQIALVSGTNVAEILMAPDGTLNVTPSALVTENPNDANGKSGKYTITPIYQGNALPAVTLTVSIHSQLPTILADSQSLSVDSAKDNRAVSVMLSLPEPYTGQGGYWISYLDDQMIQRCDGRGKQINMAMPAGISAQTERVEGTTYRMTLTTTDVQVGTYYFIMGGSIRNSGNNEGYAYPITSKVFKLVVKNSKPAPKLSASSATLNLAQDAPAVTAELKLTDTQQAEYPLADIQVKDADGNFVTADSSPLTADINVQTGTVRFAPNGAEPGVYTYTILPYVRSTANGTTLATTARTFKITVVRAQPTVSLSKSSVSLSNCMSTAGAQAAVSLAAPAKLSGGLYGDTYVAWQSSAYTSFRPAVRGAVASATIPQLALAADGTVTVTLGSQAAAVVPGSYAYTFTPELQQGTNTGSVKKAVTLTVKVTNTKPKTALSATTVLLNTNTATPSLAAALCLTDLRATYGSYRVDSVITVTPPKNGSASDIDVNLDEAGSITVQAQRALKGNYTVRIQPSISVDGQTLALNAVSFTVKPTSSKAAVTVSAKGSINLQNRDNTCVVYTIKRSNTNAQLLTAEFADAALNDKLEITSTDLQADGGMQLTVRAKDDVEWQSRERLAVSFAVILDDGANGQYVLNTKAVSLTPTEYSLKCTSSPKTATVYQSVSTQQRIACQVGFTNKVAYDEDGIADDILPVYSISTAKLTAAQQAAFTVEGDGNNDFTIVLTRPEAIKPGTYRLTLLAQPQGTSKTGGTAFTVTVTVKA